MCVLYLKSQATGNQFVELGRTERINDSHNPDFAKAFEIPYFFEEIQTLKFQIYDSDSLEGGALSQVRTA